MVIYLPRSAWNARASRGGSSLSAASVVGTALHWPGMAGRIDADGAIGQRRVASALRGWQAYHMDSRGWSDIAYQIAVDQAGRAWTLRGLNIRSGANGDDFVNARYGAILLVLGPGEAPSAAMKATVKGVVADFKKRYPRTRSRPYGHRDVRAAGTDCPGGPAYAVIGSDGFTPGKAAPSTPSQPSTPVEGTMNAAQQKLMTDGFASLHARIDLLKEEINNYTKSVDAANDLVQTDQTNRLARIEDDTDDGTPAAPANPS